MHALKVSFVFSFKKKTVLQSKNMIGFDFNVDIRDTVRRAFIWFIGVQLRLCLSFFVVVVVVVYVNPQNKLMAGQHSDVLESLTPQVRNRVEALKEIQVRQVFSHIIFYWIV